MPCGDIPENVPTGYLFWTENSPMLLFACIGESGSLSEKYRNKLVLQIFRVFSVFHGCEGLCPAENLGKIAQRGKTQKLRNLGQG